MKTYKKNAFSNQNYAGLLFEEVLIWLIVITLFKSFLLLPSHMTAEHFCIPQDQTGRHTARVLCAFLFHYRTKPLVCYLPVYRSYALV